MIKTIEAAKLKPELVKNVCLGIQKYQLSKDKLVLTMEQMDLTATAETLMEMKNRSGAMLVILLIQPNSYAIQ